MNYKNNNNMSTTPPRIISEVPVTYGEMIEILTKLGYSQAFDGKSNQYINEKYTSKVLLPVRPLDEILEKVYVAIASNHLYMQGVIKEEESLIYMIQKNRLKKSKKAANTKGQVMA
jgi:hypothetical protein